MFCKLKLPSGFLYNQLSDFKKKLINEAMDLFPKETDKFLVWNAKEFKKSSIGCLKRGKCMRIAYPLYV